mmetsp:Transcript_35395/g.114027  ORF Transcript_35395/g.114027 Transcript_35395/m.114027 type:complete len:220 (+) Transcript_35395:823-1482(+)
MCEGGSARARCGSALMRARHAPVCGSSRNGGKWRTRPQSQIPRHRLHTTRCTAARARTTHATRARTRPPCHPVADLQLVHGCWSCKSCSAAAGWAFHRTALPHRRQLHLRLPRCVRRPTPPRELPARQRLPCPMRSQLRLRCPVRQRAHRPCHSPTGPAKPQAGAPPVRKPIRRTHSKRKRARSRRAPPPLAAARPSQGPIRARRAAAGSVRRRLPRVA